MPGTENPAISGVIDLEEERNIRQNRETGCNLQKVGETVENRFSFAQEAAEEIGTAMAAMMEAYDASRGVREIRGNYRSNTGFVPCGAENKPIDFESTLERDFVHQALFDPMIDSLHQQPLRVAYRDEDGRKRTYTPDYLVEYRTNEKSATGIVEVKYEADLRCERTRLKRSFSAMREMCAEKDWIFFVLTELTIRSQYQKNVEAILPFRYRAKSPQRAIDAVLECVIEKGAISVHEVLESCSSQSKSRADVQAAIWSLVANDFIWVDLRSELLPSSLLHSRKSSDVRNPFFLWTEAG